MSRVPRDLDDDTTSLSDFPTENIEPVNIFDEEPIIPIIAEAAVNDLYNWMEKMYRFTKMKKKEQLAYVDFYGNVIGRTNGDRVKTQVPEDHINNRQVIIHTHPYRNPPRAEGGDIVAPFNPCPSSQDVTSLVEIMAGGVASIGMLPVTSNDYTTFTYLTKYEDEKQIPPESEVEGLAVGHEAITQELMNITRDMLDDHLNIDGLTTFNKDDNIDKITDVFNNQVFEAGQTIKDFEDETDLTFTLTSEEVHF